MAKEILAIPEENLLEVIKILRMGMIHATDISDETIENLTKWCNEEEEYLCTP